MERRNRINRMIKSQKNKGKNRSNASTNSDAKADEGHPKAISSRKTKENSSVRNEQHKTNKEDVESESEEAMNELIKEFAIDLSDRKQKQNEKDKKLERQKERKRMKNQKTYGYIMMGLTSIWGIFVGYIIWSTSRTLAKSSGILDTWILNSLIVSLIGMLLVVLRIVFPSEKGTKITKGIGIKKRKNRRKNKRKNRK